MVVAGDWNYKVSSSYCKKTIALCDVCSVTLKCVLQFSYYYYCYIQLLTVFFKFFNVTGHQHICMYDLGSNNPTAIINYGVSKNVTGVGFQEDGKWMYTGEDCSACIWDLG